MQFSVADAPIITLSSNKNSPGRNDSGFKFYLEQDRGALQPLVVKMRIKTQTHTKKSVV